MMDLLWLAVFFVSLSSWVTLIRNGEGGLKVIGAAVMMALSLWMLS